MLFACSCGWKLLQMRLVNEKIVTYSVTNNLGVLILPNCVYESNHTWDALYKCYCSFPTLGPDRFIYNSVQINNEVIIVVY